MHTYPDVGPEQVGMVDQAVTASVFKVEYETLPPRKWWDLVSLFWPPVPRAQRVRDLRLDFSPIVPGTISFSFEYEDANRVICEYVFDNGSGVLSGNVASGRINYETAEFTLMTTKPLPAGTKVFAHYTYDMGLAPAASVRRLRSTPRISSSARTDS